MQLYAVCINGKKKLYAVQASERMSCYAAILSYTSPQRIKRTEQIIFIGISNLRDKSHILNFFPPTLMKYAQKSPQVMPAGYFHYNRPKYKSQSYI